MNRAFVSAEFAENRIRRLLQKDRLEERILRHQAMCDVAFWIFLIGCGALGAYGATVGLK